MMRFFIYILVMGTLLYAEGVPAGTKIENSATLNYVMSGVNFSVQSNKVVDIVDQKIDMQVVCQESAAVVVGVSEKKRALAFRLTNRGNGADSYDFQTLEGENSNFSVEHGEIYMDNGDGVFSLASEQLVNEVNLSQDESQTLFFVSDIPAEAEGVAQNGIKIHSKLQGDLLYGASTDLGDYYAVMVAKEDALSDFCSYEVSKLELKLEKSAALSSDELYAGTTIHYSIAVKVIGTGVIEEIVVSDKIPKGTVYVPNTLQLDGVAFGDFNGTAITVAIGEIEQVEESDEPKHLITFDTKVL